MGTPGAKREWGSARPIQTRLHKGPKGEKEKDEVGGGRQTGRRRDRDRDRDRDRWRQRVGEKGRRGYVKWWLTLRGPPRPQALPSLAPNKAEVKATCGQEPVVFPASARRKHSASTGWGKSRFTVAPMENNTIIR